MRPLSDTSPEAQRVLSEVYRAMPPGRKVRLIAREFDLARALHEAGFRHRNPRASSADVQDSWGSSMLGASLWKTIKRGAPMEQDRDNLAVLREVVGAFESLGLAYAVGGSWASSRYGEPRMTRDADVTVEPFPGREQLLADHFGSEYYLSVDAAREANREHASFNIIHIPSAFKVDVFIRKNEPFELTMFARRVTGTMEEAPNQPLVWVTPEDTVLLKLRWYRLGNEISDRQWSDVLGVLRTQSGGLDEAYMDHWAVEIGVVDLWHRAREEATTRD